MTEGQKHKILKQNTNTNNLILHLIKNYNLFFDGDYVQYNTTIYNKT